jgi:hypothetical protein
VPLLLVENYIFAEGISLILFGDIPDQQIIPDI